MRSSYFLEKGLGIVSSPHFVYDFSRKMFLVFYSIKVAPRVENTEVFKKGWNFANRTYSGSCIMKKHFFSIMDERNSVFSLFLPWNYLLQRWTIWLRNQLQILLVHFYILKHKHKSNIKGGIFELKSSYIFRNQPYREVLEVKRQACQIFFPTCFLQSFS